LIKKQEKFSKQLKQLVDYILLIINHQLNLLKKDEDEITCITLSPNNKHLITSHRNILLKQWDWSESLCIRTWKATHIAPIQSMNIDSTSSLLATGSSDFTCKIWDLNAQYCTHNLKGAQGIIRLIIIKDFLFLEN
jgi:U3 small nucleolar RNA-associated protein 13